jgi:hypothetical protein
VRAKGNPCREFETEFKAGSFRAASGRLLLSFAGGFRKRRISRTTQHAPIWLDWPSLSRAIPHRGGTIVSLRHFSARYWQGMSVASIITALPLRLPSVTVGKRESPPNREERFLPRQRLTDWIVPPVIVPLLPFLFILAVVAWRG